MPSKKRNALPFDQRGSRIVFRTYLLKSDVYLALSPQAKVLMQLLQMHWNNFKPVDYGVREAVKKIPCSHSKAGKSFYELLNSGFTECMEEMNYNTHTGSTPRKWRLTWLPFQGKPPTNEWEKIKVGDPNMDH